MSEQPTLQQTALTSAPHSPVSAELDDDFADFADDNPTNEDWGFDHFAAASNDPSPPPIEEKDTTSVEPAALQSQSSIDPTQILSSLFPLSTEVLSIFPLLAPPTDFDTTLARDEARSNVNQYFSETVPATKWEKTHPSANEPNPAFQKLKWKRSALRQIFLSALQEPLHLDHIEPTWSPASSFASSRKTLPSHDRSRRQRTFTPTEDDRPASERSSIDRDGRSRIPSPGPYPSPVTSISSKKSAAALALSVSSLAKAFNIANAKKLCTISQDALMKRRPEELQLVHDHIAQVAEQAVAHLRYIKDCNEEEIMQSEMNHKMIEKLVTHAQRVSSDKGG